MTTKSTSTEPRISYLKSMVAARLAMGKLVKNAKNPHFKNTYADLAAVMDTITQPLLDNGLIVEQSISVLDGSVMVDTIITHVDGHQEAFGPLPMPIGGRGDAQAIGSAITYARRYSLTAIFGLAADDDDGNATQRQPSKPATKPATKKPAPPSGPSNLDDVPPVNPDGPFDDDNAGHAKSISKDKLIQPNTMKRLHAVGTELYGDDWNDKRPELVQFITTGAETSASKLSEDEAQRIIKGMNDKIASK